MSGSVRPPSAGTAARRLARAALAVLPLLHAACDARRADPDLVIATTTSLYDSGLLDSLLPAFTAAHPGVRTRVLAVGSGQALALGRRADVDVVLVHAPAEEARFMDEGAGRRRVEVMRNDMLLVGPETDPARAAVAGSAAAALRGIAAADARFISRGDSSGTHQLELQLWRLAAVDADQRRRVVAEAGQGMAETLAIASERAAYTLVDRATFLMLQPTLQLRVLLQGDSALANVYSVITVAGAANPADADRFADWLLSAEAAARIRSFGAAGASAPLFQPVSSH